MIGVKEYSYLYMVEKKMISGMCFFKVISFRHLKQSNS